MIDPRFITKYDRTDSELQELAVFSICVAGKNAKTIAKAVDKLKGILCGEGLDGLILIEIYKYNRTAFDKDYLANLMSKCGIGCASNRVRPCINLARKVLANANYLRECTVEDLESIWGIGSKTARFFILHSRAGARVAALDIHLLRFLKDCGIDAPRTTPPKGSDKYKQLEQNFLKIADLLGESPSGLDLKIWNNYSKNGATYGTDDRTVRDYAARIKAACG
jgi:thermostable 8-oxoguanine DNA glycosylase